MCVHYRVKKTIHTLKMSATCDSAIKQEKVGANDRFTAIETAEKALISHHFRLVKLNAKWRRSLSHLTLILCLYHLMCLYKAWHMEDVVESTTRVEYVCLQLTVSLGILTKPFLKGAIRDGHSSTIRFFAIVQIIKCFYDAGSFAFLRYILDISFMVPQVTISIYRQFPMTATYYIFHQLAFVYMNTLIVTSSANVKKAENLSKFVKKL